MATAAVDTDCPCGAKLAISLDDDDSTYEVLWAILADGLNDFRETHRTHGRVKQRRGLGFVAAVSREPIFEDEPFDGLWSGADAGEDDDDD